MLKKDTKEAFNKHKAFFDRINSNLVSIHSFGFSFSDVDLYYIQRIAEKVTPSEVIWYINEFDNNTRNEESNKGRRFKKKLEKVEKMGFKIEVDKRW